MNHHGVPETQLGLFVERDHGKNVIRGRREHLPGRQLANAVGGFVTREGFGHLPCHSDEELLQDLHAEATDPRLPQSCEQSFSRGLFLASGSVEGVDEDVGVDEFASRLSAREARRGSRSAARACQAIERISSPRALAFSRLNIGDPRPPGGTAPRS